MSKLQQQFSYMAYEAKVLIDDYIPLFSADPSELVYTIPATSKSHFCLPIGFLFDFDKGAISKVWFFSPYDWYKNVRLFYLCIA